MDHVLGVFTFHPFCNISLCTMTEGTKWPGNSFSNTRSGPRCVFLVIPYSFAPPYSNQLPDVLTATSIQQATLISPPSSLQQSAGHTSHAAECHVSTKTPFFSRLRCSRQKSQSCWGVLKETLTCSVRREFVKNYMCRFFFSVQLTE